MTRRSPFTREILKKVKGRNAYLKGQADADEEFVRSRCLGYMIRIIRHYPLWDTNTLDFLNWLSGGQLGELKQIVVSLLPSGQQRTILEMDMDQTRGSDLIQSVSFALARIPKSRLSKLASLTEKFLEKELRKTQARNHSKLGENLKDFKSLFGLTEKEAELCMFLAIMSTWTQAENYFDSHLNCDRYSGRKYLLAALDLSTARFQKIVYGRLRGLSFITEDRSWLELSRDCLPLINESVMAVLNREHYQPLPQPTVALENHAVKCDDLDHLKILLAKRQSSATHILFYGEPGTGKTSFTRSLAASLGCPAFEVKNNTENKAHNRRLSLMACLNLTNHSEGSLVVVDEADSLLNTDDGWFMRGESQDKGWLNTLLEEPGSRVIWITNRVENIDASVRRRFAYSLNFPKFGRQQREQLWVSILRRHRLKSYFKKEDISHLAAQYEVSAGAMDLAVDKARESGFDSKGDLLLKINRSLAAHLTLLRGGRRIKEGPTRETGYVSGALNLSCDSGALERQVRRFDKWWRLPVAERPVKSLNLLFHGPSGTGKTELARHLAFKLDRPLLVKRTSDLLGSLVGETEQAIARAFDQAETGDAILLIDEADSLLFPRSRAQRSWEVSFTNEFLTQMEQFRGMLICTTNRIADLDDASLRRFGRKVEFGYLNGDGILALYDEMMAPLLSRTIPARQRVELAKLDYLTPGIFRVVRDDLLMGEDCCGHEMVVELLKEEAGLMAEREKKVIGF